MVNGDWSGEAKDENESVAKPYIQWYVVAKDIFERFADNNFSTIIIKARISLRVLSITK